MTPASARKNLPEGWRLAQLAEVCSVHPGQHILETDYNSCGDGIGYLTGPADFGAKWPTVQRWTRKPKAWCEPGDVLVTVKGAGVGKANLAPSERVAIGRQLMAIRPKPGTADQFFLYCVLITKLSGFQATASGSTVPGLGRSEIESLEIPFPPLAQQKRIAVILAEQLAAVERARAAAEAQLEAAKALPAAYLRQSLAGSRNLMALSDCLIEVSRGIGSTWSQYRVLGATRAGLALAKERVGKHPERYKLVDAGTIFYNPMRILLGSIAMVDEGDETGITSPDYVVLKTKQGVLHPRWFYYWLRSPEGDCFIKTLTRGAVRERMLFRRLAEASIELPPWSAQTEAAAKLTPVRTAAETMAQQLAAINALPAALLRPAFSGEL